jgi:tRNA(Arg) A34 adenosine deaminase TadA
MLSTVVVVDKEAYIAEANRKRKVDSDPTVHFSALITDRLYEMYKNEKNTDISLYWYCC